MESSGGAAAFTGPIMFTTNNIQAGTPVGIQYQTTATTADVNKQVKIDGMKATQQTPEFSTFYANVNMIQKLTPTSQALSTVNLAQLADDTKTVQYLQPFSYANCALVNQIPNGVTGITVDGRQLVVNKPITSFQNTISNISFKCDVCGLMFNHLTLLNHHKRTHNQDGEPTSDAITVVTQPQVQNIISETGQTLGQIQIVATEALDPAPQQQQLEQQAHAQQQAQQHAQQQAQQHAQQQQQQQQQQHQQIVQISHMKEKVQKCITCGGPIQNNPKRKGPKLIRCETCISNDNAHNVNRPTQIFVAPDGDIKFEIGEIPNTSNESSIDSLMPTQQITTIKTENVQMVTAASVAASAPMPSHPVKKRNLATVTKCNKCNGSGVIIVGGKKQHLAAAASPSAAATLHQHQQTQEKPFTCNTCGGRFSRYSSLWSHKKLHSGEKNYKCNVCGIAFAKAVYLKNHTRIHTGEKPYKCGTCGMQFSQSPHLKNHERTHSGEKPYVCEVCDKGFARHATLWNHRRIHTGEKPYKCNRCQSAFSQAAHLKNHEKVHSGLKPFKCDICSAAFADRFALKRHRGIHEKYGQTAPLHGQIVHKEEIIEMDEKSREVIIGSI